MTGSNSLSSTAGQSVGNTINSPDNIITQGFHQPNSFNPVTVSLVVSLNQCNETYTVQVASITNCGNPAGATIYWNNVASDTIASGLPNLSTLEIIGTNGCVYINTFNLANMSTTDLPCVLQFYNFFSPNNDKSNDVWWIENIEDSLFRDNKIKIFNRWGLLVWSTDGYDNVNKVWRGENKQGQDLPDGTYYFQAEINSNTRTGFIELIR